MKGKNGIKLTLDPISSPSEKASHYWRFFKSKVLYIELLEKKGDEKKNPKSAHLEKTSKAEKDIKKVGIFREGH